MLNEIVKMMFMCIYGLTYFFCKGVVLGNKSYPNVLI